WLFPVLRRGSAPARFASWPVLPRQGEQPPRVTRTNSTTALCGSRVGACRAHITRWCGFNACQPQELLVSSRYTPTNAMLPGYVVSTDSDLLPPEADAAAVEQHLIDRGRQHRYHHSEQARNNACEQGKRRKEKRQRKAAQRAAAV